MIPETVKTVTLSGWITALATIAGAYWFIQDVKLEIEGILDEVTIMVESDKIYINTVQDEILEMQTSIINLNYRLGVHQGEHNQ